MSEHWCPIHGVEFFKTPRMKGYAHPVTDAEGKKVYKHGKQVWCNEDDLASGEPEPASMPRPQVAPPPTHEEERTEWAPHPKKQASIEAQNARTNLTSLCVAGKLAEDAVLSKAEEQLILLLTVTAGFPRGNPTDSIVSSPMVQEAVRQGGVVTKVTSKEFPNLGAFLNRCHTELGLERTEVEKILDVKLSTSTDFEGAWVALNDLVGK